MLLGGVFFAFVMIFGIAFVILSQSGGGASNPLLELFGLTEAELYPFLINMANILFGLVDFAAFVLVIIGVFKVGTAKKDDKVKRKKGVTLTAVGIVLFMLISTAWAGSYFYLQEKKAQYERNIKGEVQYILTDPENTSNLTAPALVEFDASKLPVDQSKFTVISYAWDFADGSVGTGEKVSHMYTSKEKKMDVM